MQKRDLGREGEDAFRGWCNNGGLSINPSSDSDKTGWDFIVEFPTESQKGISLDRQNSPIECKVQVKSSESIKKKLQVKISVLYRLVSYIKPAFFCFIEYNKSHGPQAAYLLHLDEEWINKILKRIRELEVKGKADKLHKSKMTMDYTGAYKLPSLDGKGIKEAIQAFIDEGMNKYVDRKNKTLTNCGELGFKMNLTLGEKELKDFINVSLGLKEMVSIDKLKVFETRFGIDLPDNKFPDSSNGNTRLSMPELKPQESIKVYFKENDYSVGMEFKGELFVPAIGLFAPEQYFKLRIVLPIAEIIVDEKRTKINFNWNLKNYIKLNEFKKRVWIFDKISNGKELIFELKPENGELISGKISARDVKIKFPDNLLSYVDKMIFICSKFDLEPSNVTVNLDLLYQYQKNIVKLFLLLKMDPREFKFEIAGDSSSDELENDKIAFIHAIKARIGDYAFAIIVSSSTEEFSFKANEKLEMNCQKKEVYKQFCESVKVIEDLDLNIHIQEYKKELESKGYYVPGFASDEVEV